MECCKTAAPSCRLGSDREPVCPQEVKETAYAIVAFGWLSDLLFVERIGSCGLLFSIILLLFVGIDLSARWGVLVVDDACSVSAFLSSPSASANHSAMQKRVNDSNINLMVDARHFLGDVELMLCRLERRGKGGGIVTVKNRTM